MESAASDLIGDSIKLYALMTPPAVLSAFLGYTKNYEARQKHRIAAKTATAIFILGSALYIFGSRIFELFGFTLDAFRIGAGVLLMLTAIGQIRNEEDEKTTPQGDISVVPLAIPLGMGPASIGALMVMGASAQTSHELLGGIISLLLAALGMFALLRLANATARLLRPSGIAVLAKLTGLLLAAIAAQIIFSGIVGFLEL